MAKKKESKEDVEKKEPKKSTSKKTEKADKPAAKVEEPVKAEEEKKEEAPVKEEAEEVKEQDSPEKSETPEKPKILKSSDVELPEDEPAGDKKIVVSHEKAAKADEGIEVVSAEEAMKEAEDFIYDFKKHEIKPYKGPGITSHEMHDGKYGIIPDVLKEKKKKK